MSNGCDGQRWSEVSLDSLLLRAVLFYLVGKSDRSLVFCPELSGTVTPQGKPVTFSPMSFYL